MKSRTRPNKEKEESQLPRRRLTPRSQLYELAMMWEEDGRRDGSDEFIYQTRLDEILFHAELRFCEYEPFRDDGEFPTRLLKWLENVREERQRKALFRLVPHILFLDKQQTRAMYKDAYRRIIVPWIVERHLTSQDMVAVDFDSRVKSALKSHILLHVTESFRAADFIDANDLAGIPQMDLLGEDLTQIPVRIASRIRPGLQGVIVFEDFVGTGKQVLNVLSAMNSQLPSEWRRLFVPLVILEAGLRNLHSLPEQCGFEIRPALVVPDQSCVKEHPVNGEPREFKAVRALIKATSATVLERDGSMDDTPIGPFGYQGCGGLIVTWHNVPNNTLPLIHHRAPQWQPLFRRLQNFRQ